MKTNAQINSQSKRQTRLENLVSLCYEKYSEDEIMEAMRSVTDTEWVEKPDEDDMVGELAELGYVILKPDTMVEKERLLQCAEKVFPYYNEQQTRIFSYF